MAKARYFEYANISMMSAGHEASSLTLHNNRVNAKSNIPQHDADISHFSSAKMQSDAIDGHFQFSSIYGLQLLALHAQMIFSFSFEII